jgi:hypothetical protein
MGLMIQTPWKVVTSSEKSGSLIVGLAFGDLYFQNEDDGEELTVHYRCLSLSAGTGAPKAIGAAWSKKTDPSGGFDNVGASPGRDFGSHIFPCRGYMFGVGASAAVVGSILGMDVTGGGVTAVLFGQVPVFAGVRMWGLGRAALPGAGISGGLAHFWTDS